jgi:hypothetical protein
MTTRVGSPPVWESMTRMDRWAGEEPMRSGVRSKHLGNRDANQA